MASIGADVKFVCKLTNLDVCEYIELHVASFFSIVSFVKIFNFVQNYSLEVFNENQDIQVMENLTREK